jgi:hypothetical protein
LEVAGLEYIYIPAAAAEGIVGRISFWGRKKKYLNDTAVNSSLQGGEGD